MKICYYHCLMMMGCQGRRKLCHCQTFSDGARRMSSRQAQLVEVHVGQQISRSKSRQHAERQVSRKRKRRRAEVHAGQQISRRKSRQRAGQHAEQESRRRNRQLVEVHAERQISRVQKLVEDI